MPPYKQSITNSQYVVLLMLIETKVIDPMKERFIDTSLSHLGYEFWWGAPELIEYLRKLPDREGYGDQ